MKSKHLYLKTFILSFVSLTAFSQDSIRFYQTIDTLCSPYFYGRGYENDGHVKSAQYLYARFQSVDSVWNQTFQFKLNHFENQMLLTLDDEAMRPCEDYIPLPQASSGVGSLKIRFLDSLFFSNEESINKFIKNKLGKCAIFYNEADESKITSNKSLRNKIYTEAQLIVKLTTNETLRSFSTEAWMPSAFTLKKSKFKNQKECSFELHQQIETIESKNVIAEIQGKDTTLPKLILCAHYDHVGGYENCFIPGANDNASGVSMLLELFEYYSQHTPNRTIRFIAFGGEEVGLIGSKNYVNQNNLSDIHFVLNLDLIGAGSQGVTVVNATKFVEQFSILEKINNDAHWVVNIKKRGEAANSDHYYFTQKGIPSFFIYTNGTVGGYHNKNDTPNKLEKGYFSSLFGLLQSFCDGL